MRGTWFAIALRACLFSAGALALAGCNEQPAVQAAQSPAATEVSVVTLQPSPRPFVRELPGRVAPTRIAEIRPRVSGVVVERAFTQGSTVRAGDILYRIDPRPFEVELESVKAALAKAQALQLQARQQADRFTALLPKQSVSQAQYEVALATKLQADAEVAAAEANVDRALLNLDYATVRAPIKGRVSRAIVTEGALVQADVTHLTTVQQLDPIYVDFTQSVGELNQLKADLRNGTLEAVAPDAAKVRLVRDDGSLYPDSGKLLFSDTMVDQTTGQVSLRSEFPNAGNELLPGTYVRVLIEQGVDTDALVVPQQAVQRNSAGSSELYVLDKDDRAILTPVRMGRTVDQDWIVASGVQGGDRVVVEGFQKLTSGLKVKPMPWSRTTASIAGEPASQNVTHDSIVR
jgi:membrane fusion protein (multidrug efflux system)